MFGLWSEFCGESHSSHVEAYTKPDETPTPASNHPISIVYNDKKKSPSRNNPDRYNIVRRIKRGIR